MSSIAALAKTLAEKKDALVMLELDYEKANNEHKKALHEFKAAVQEVLHNEEAVVIGGMVYARDCEGFFHEMRLINEIP